MALPGRRPTNGDINPHDEQIAEERAHRRRGDYLSQRDLRDGGNRAADLWERDVERGWGDE